MTYTELQKEMTITLHHDGNGYVSFTPAGEGFVYYDTYFGGASLFHSVVKCEQVADLIIELMNKGYYMK